MTALRFTGRVELRSSAGAGPGPPGEAEIQGLNPGRVERILAATGWPRLEPGSLNLRVPERVVEALGGLHPLLVEDGRDVVYPRAYRHVPRRRKSYLYYRAVAVSQEQEAEVLVRRAQVPLKRRLELFAPFHLRGEWDLRPGDLLEVRIFGGG